MRRLTLILSVFCLVIHIAVYAAANEKQTGIIGKWSQVEEKFVPSFMGPGEVRKTDSLIEFFRDGTIVIKDKTVTIADPNDDRWGEKRGKVLDDHVSTVTGSYEWIADGKMLKIFFPNTLDVVTYEVETPDAATLTLAGRGSVEKYTRVK